MSKINSWPEITDQIPDYALLTFPPFPATIDHVVSLRQWSNPGIWKASLPSSAGQSKQQLRAAKDCRGNLLVNIGEIEEPTASNALYRQQRRFAHGGGLLHLPNSDCFKLGQENSDWREPEGTGRPDSYAVSRPPFERLMTATRDFIESRSEALQTTRTKRLFGQLRNAFGIRSDLPGRHWPGTGPDGQPYTMPKMIARTESWMDPSQIPVDDEVCVLLRRPEESLRGYVALLRRECEAGWEISQSIKMAEIMATYFAYIEHYQVFADSPYDKQFASVSRMATMAPRLLREAHAVEESIGQARGLNRATWTIWGGQYGGAERSGFEREETDWPISENPELGPSKTDTGGWEVERPTDTRPIPLKADQVTFHIESLIVPVDRTTIKLLGHIPYARRLVTAVLPPLLQSTGPRFQRLMHRLVTGQAPWSDAEGWRRQTLPSIDLDSPDTAESHDPKVLEGDPATITEPDEIILWVDSEVLQGESGATRDIVGMGLRGRWGLYGTLDGCHSWWAFKAKDYVLPSIWLSPSEHEKA